MTNDQMMNQNCKIMMYMYMWVCMYVCGEV